MTKKRVLVVDDSEPTRKMIVAVLGRNAKLQVDTAASGTEGLEKTKAATPAVIVLDMMLPEMSGMEFIEQLHSEMTGTLPAIVAITGASEVAVPDSVIRAADQKSVRAIFRKPIDQARLAAAVADCAGV